MIDIEATIKNDPGAAIASLTNMAYAVIAKYAADNAARNSKDRYRRLMGTMHYYATETARTAVRRIAEALEDAAQDAETWAGLADEMSEPEDALTLPGTCFNGAELREDIEYDADLAVSDVDAADVYAAAWPSERADIDDTIADYGLGSFQTVRAALACGLVTVAAAEGVEAFAHLMEEVQSELRSAFVGIRDLV